MNGSGLKQKVRKAEKAPATAAAAGEKVVVAVKASTDIPKSAIVWALTHVVQPGDCITLLVVVPSHGTVNGRKLWGFPIFAGDCVNGHKKLHIGTTLEQKSEITESCSQVMLQLHNVYDPNKIDVNIKIVSGSPSGAVATESKRAQASWVVLDRQLEHEKKRCMEELQCNIVVMKRSHAKVLRLNLVGYPDVEGKEPSKLSAELDISWGKLSKHSSDPANSIRGPAVTPSSSPEVSALFTATEAGTSSISSSDPGTSPFFISDSTEIKEEEITPKQDRDLDTTSSESDSEGLSQSTALENKPWIAEVLSTGQSSSKVVEKISQRFRTKFHIPQVKALSENVCGLDQEPRYKNLNVRLEMDINGNVREAVCLTRTAPPGPPPLCSICQHKAPVFGKPPRWFSYAELELATGGFSQVNFLAEGGFGSVHRGVLPDGQAIAVKQHKLASTQGDLEFCSEVEVLSCAQHRNVVMLIGFCVEDKRRLLVYEYICNGSLDSHLYGRHREPFEWSARQKIAVGAARGLRYLHEECRVGCIVHRDMRPNNILITHDFEPLVGDFGLARWQPDGDLAVETRVIGTFGYLAPEYAQSGQITEKADVYSFGVVLVELVTGRKAVDISRPKGQQCLTEWARPLLEEHAIDELVDPRLGDRYNEHEVNCMLHAASLCIRRDPHSRPKMSQVLRTLDGDAIMEPNYMSTTSYDPGNRSGRMLHDDRHHQRQSSISSLVRSSQTSRLERHQE